MNNFNWLDWKSSRSVLTYVW